MNGLLSDNQAMQMNTMYAASALHKLCVYICLMPSGQLGGKIVADVHRHVSLRPATYKQDAARCNLEYPILQCQARSLSQRTATVWKCKNICVRTRRYLALAKTTATPTAAHDASASDATHPHSSSNKRASDCDQLPHTHTTKSDCPYGCPSQPFFPRHRADVSRIW